LEFTGYHKKGRKALFVILPAAARLYKRIRISFQSMDKEKKSIAFFDFDGTITTKDSFLEMIKWVKGEKSFLLGFGFLSPWMLAMKLNLISKSSGKEKVLKHFFGGEKFSDFQNNCERFVRQKLPSLIRPQALSKIREHQQTGATVVVVTASASNFVEPWTEQNNLTCLATELEVKDGLITGKIEGRNCNGREKARRIRERFDLAAYDAIYAYGDTKGDKPMLDLAHFSSFKPFRD
jgi:phosphatidylglycerophosphatase C